MPCKESEWTTSGGSVDENLPVDAGDTCSIPGLGRAHVPRGSQASGPRALEPVRLEPGRHSEKPVHHGEEQSLLTSVGESEHTATKARSSQKQIHKWYLKSIKKKKRKVSGIPCDITATETAWVSSQADCHPSNKVPKRSPQRNSKHLQNPSCPARIREILTAEGL